MTTPDPAEVCSDDFETVFDVLNNFDFTNFTLLLHLLFKLRRNEKKD